MLFQSKTSRIQSFEEKYPNTEFFLVRIQNKMDQNKLRIWTLFTKVVKLLSAQSQEKIREDMKKSQTLKKLNWQDNAHEIRKGFCKEVWLSLTISLSIASPVFIFFKCLCLFLVKVDFVTKIGNDLTICSSYYIFSAVSMMMPKIVSPKNDHLKHFFSSSRHFRIIYL